MTGDWRNLNLMDCVEIVNSGVHEFKGEKKYIATGSLENDNILNHVNVTYNSRPSRANMEFNKDDVIFAKMKDTEKVFLIDEETSHNLYSTGFAGLRIKQNNKIIPKFLYFWIKSPVFQKEKNRKSGGATQKAINNSKIKEFTLFVPPIETQKKIVEILEKAEKLKEYRQKSDELTNSYLESIFLEMFGDVGNNTKNYEIVTIKDIAKVDTKSVKPSNFLDGIYIGLEHIESKTGKILKTNSIADVKIKSNKYSFNENHVLYGKLRPYLNKVALPVFKGVCSTDIIPILPIHNMSNKIFIKYLLSLDYYVNLATEYSTGANLPRISPKKLEKFKVPLPPTELQNKFKIIVEAVEKIKEYQKQSGIEIDNLFNNLMQKSFKGSE